MNIITMVFAGVIVMIMLFFGLGTVQSLYDNSNIIEGDALYDEYNTGTEITKQTFGFMGYIGLIIFIVALFGTLMLLTKVVT